MPSDPRGRRAGLTRRQLLARGGLLGAGALLAPALLAACGDDDDGATAATGAAGTGAAGSKTGTVTMLNWPLYLENDQDPQAAPSIKGFTAATGIEVDYTVGIDGNDSFYTKYEPELSKGRGIGVDIVVLTSWMAARMIEKGFVQPFDEANMPNKKKLKAPLASPAWDRGRSHALPWAIVLAGIGYYPEKTGFEITSMNDLFDPRLKNRVTILDEMRDTVGLTMLGMGLDPATGGVDDVKKAIDKIGRARDGGQFRKVTGNSYTEDLGLGDVWAAVAWAGDIATLQADHPDLQWVFPAEGAMAGVDNAMIPIGAPNKAGAEAFLNYMYDPKVAGPFSAAISYPSPVEGAEQFMPEAARKSVFVNPSGVKTFEFRSLTEDEDAEVAEAFAKATQQ